jgi:hypothetical protein
MIKADAQDHVYRSLPRLLKKAASTAEHLDQGKPADIWDLVRQNVEEGSDSIRRVCKWLRVLSYSGVEIPWTLLSEITASNGTQNLSNDSRLDLVIAVDANSAAIAPSEFARLCCRMFADFARGQEGLDAAVVSDTT